MTYTDTHIQWVDAIIPNLPINRFFNVDDIVQSSIALAVGQNQSIVSEFLDNFLRDNSFVVENLLSIYYADDVDKVYLDLTAEGKRLKHQGSYEKYLALLEKEERSRKIKVWKENGNLVLSLIAAVASVAALISWDKDKKLESNAKKADTTINGTLDTAIISTSKPTYDSTVKKRMKSKHSNVR